MANSGVGTRPAKDPIVRISPHLRASMPGRTRRVTRRVARVLMAMMSSISRSGVSAKETGMAWEAPTLLIRMAILSSWIVVARRAYSAGVAWAKSIAKVLVVREGLWARISAAMASSFDCVRETRRMEKW